VPQVTAAPSPPHADAPILRRVRAGAKKAAATAAPAADAREALAAVSAVMKALADPRVSVDQLADMIVTATVRLAGADNGAFIRRDGDAWIVGAIHGDPPFASGERHVAEAISIWGRAVLSGQRFHYADTKFAEPQLPDAEKRRTRMAVPIVRDGESIAVLAMSRNDPGGFEPSTIALIETFADQLAVAMENARLLKETKESLERQSAIAEILEAISASPTAVEPVLDTIAASAARICNATYAGVTLLENGALRMRQSVRRAPGAATMQRAMPLEGTVSGAAVLRTAVVQVDDILASEEFPVTRESERRIADGTRTVLAVPLLREGEAIGTIFLRRAELRRFTEKEIGLLKTFADQAVIAIENVRLFNETKESLERETAVAGVLRAISGSPPRRPGRDGRSLRPDAERSAADRDGRDPQRTRHARAPRCPSREDAGLERRSHAADDARRSAPAR